VRPPTRRLHRNHHQSRVSSNNLTDSVRPHIPSESGPNRAMPAHPWPSMNARRRKNGNIRI
jgi:hypothetical protein